ncbi:Na/Pi cotransporter family protein [Maridesulfovibrio ferrireducens]|uniref:Na/Pi cotransporter family protein n=1 Tax=Maridesulfovibrio ferrireducens TaxID=246191 RepID=UPI001A35F5B8|nr:Na/Pi cotransporter family protein [Maridesulfovibrio ferrireducens]MBI9110564.1 Na/Pi cotransporter family protein [Maridesulfovibrio ferrireducens]
MTFTLLANLLGGLGLFLIGMRLMTQGLRHAAGHSLRRLLGEWTKNPGRGLISGFFITALVQSSSAVTVAVIGFVNAGLLTLTQSIGVIYGSNIGTTVTGWIVATAGFNVNIKGLALPLIACGAILRLTGSISKRAYFGDALAGFGLFFLGISTLQQSFKGIESTLDLSTFASSGFISLPIFLGIGIILTLLMQSSSAAMALVLTATISGLMDLNQGAAAVIGTNIGTTSTAALSVIGATINAKRVAIGHIIFNTVTALVALLILPILLNAIIFTTQSLGLTNEPAFVLAIFHTLFNILGVVILWPFTKRLVTFLERSIGRKGYEKDRPKYLDKNVVNSPSLAVDALNLELERIGIETRSIMRKGLNSNFNYAALNSDKDSLENLIEASRTFCAKMQSQPLTEIQGQQIATALRILQYYRTAGTLSASLAKKGIAPDTASLGPDSDLITVFINSCLGVLNTADNPCSAEFCQIDNMIADMLSAYHDLKAKLLSAGGRGIIQVPDMVDQLELFSKIRRIAKQSAKGSIYLMAMKPGSGACCPGTGSIKFAWNRHW